MIGIIKSMPPWGLQPVAMNRDLWIYIDMPTKWIVFFRVSAIFQGEGVGGGGLYVRGPKLQLLD